MIKKEKKYKENFGSKKILNTCVGEQAGSFTYVVCGCIAEIPGLNVEIIHTHIHTNKLHRIHYKWYSNGMLGVIQQFQWRTPEVWVNFNSRI